jgi:hypothetical protein
VVTVQLAARDPRRAVDLVNLYITNAVQYTLALEAKQAGIIANEYLRKQIAEMDQDIKFLEDQFPQTAHGSTFEQQAGRRGRAG